MHHLASDPKLESLARTGLKSLFAQGAELVSNECLPGVGNSQIFIRVLDIEFRIIQTEGSLRIFTIFHPGVFTIIHPPPGFAFRFLPVSFLRDNQHQNAVR